VLVIFGVGELLYKDLKNMSKIIESNKISDVLKYVDEKTLVLFDIDNTLIWSVEEFGSLEWSTHTSGRLCKNGMSLDEAITKTCTIFLQIHDLISFRTIEPDTISVLDELDKKNISNMALTKRVFWLNTPTIKQLSSVGIDFSKNPLHEKEIIFDDTFGFDKGVLYSGLYEEKGDALIKLLEKIDHKSDNILFVDDSDNHAREVYETLNSYGIPTTCIRYGAADHRSVTFDPAQAEQELLKVIGQERFDQILKELE
jgi:hypothetical protein